MSSAQEDLAGATKLVHSLEILPCNSMENNYLGFSLKDEGKEEE